MKKLVIRNRNKSSYLIDCGDLWFWFEKVVFYIIIFVEILVYLAGNEWVGDLQMELSKQNFICIPKQHLMTLLVLRATAHQRPCSVIEVIFSSNPSSPCYLKCKEDAHSLECVCHGENVPQSFKIQYIWDDTEYPRDSHPRWQFHALNETLLVVLFSADICWIFQQDPQAVHTAHKQHDVDGDNGEDGEGER